LEPDNGKYYSGLGDSLLSVQAFELASYALDQAIRFLADHFDLLINKAAALSHFANLEDKTAFAKDLIKQYPHQATFYEVLGDLYESNNLLEEAAGIYQTMTKQFPGGSKGYLRLGIVYGKQGKMRMAKSEFKKAVQFDKTLSKNHEVQKVLEYQGV